MPQTRPNKGVAPVNGDAWNLTPDLATLIDSLAVCTPVASQTERDALDKTKVTLVLRKDIGTIEWNDGTNWYQLVSQPAFGHCGATASTNLTTTVAVVAVTTAQILRAGMTYNNTKQGLVVPYTGLYEIHAKARFSGGGGGTASNVVMEIYKNTNTPTGVIVRQNKGAGTDTTDAATEVISLNAGDNLYMVGYTVGSGGDSAYGEANGIAGCYFEAEYRGV